MALGGAEKHPGPFRVPVYENATFRWRFQTERLWVQAFYQVQYGPDKMPPSGGALLDRGPIYAVLTPMCVDCVLNCPLMGREPI